MHRCILDKFPSEDLGSVLCLEKDGEPPMRVYSRKWFENRGFFWDSDKQDWLDSDGRTVCQSYYHKHNLTPPEKHNLREYMGWWEMHRNG